MSNTICCYSSPSGICICLVVILVVVICCVQSRRKKRIKKIRKISFQKCRLLFILLLGCFGWCLVAGRILHWKLNNVSSLSIETISSFFFRFSHCNEFHSAVLTLGLNKPGWACDAGLGYRWHKLLCQRRKLSFKCFEQFLIFYYMVRNHHVLLKWPFLWLGGLWSGFDFLFIFYLFF